MRNARTLLSVGMVLAAASAAQALNAGDTVYATSGATLQLPGRIVANVPRTTPLAVAVVHDSGHWIWTTYSGKRGWIQRASVRTELNEAPRQDRSLDERRCAELGTDRARLVYPTDGDIDPYPVCKAWKWNDEDGWGWDWSESNCPWKQCKDCDSD